MKTNTLIIAVLLSGITHAESDFQRMYDRQHGNKNKETPEQILKSHAEGSKEVAREQDELSADVQELIQGETNAKVIDFLAEAEELMAQATDRLEELDTSGTTIAIETEIIEKIAAAAKAASSISKSVINVSATAGQVALGAASTNTNATNLNQLSSDLTKLVNQFKI